MSILIMGATGNTGLEVAKTLALKKTDYKVFVRSIEKAKSLGFTKDQVKLGSFEDIDSIIEAMEGISHVYLAMVAHPNNRQWVSNVLTAMEKSGAKHLVKLSGMGAKMDSESEIIRTHAITDMMVKQSGLNYTIIQPNSFYQNLFGSLKSIQKSGRFFLPLGQAKQSVVDIRDVAEVAAESLTNSVHTNQTYVLSGPQALTFTEQAQIISKAATKDVDYVPITKDASEEALKNLGMNNWLAKSLTEIMIWFSQGGYDYVTGDIERVLGRPARGFEDFAEEFAELLK